MDLALGLLELLHAVIEFDQKRHHFGGDLVELGEAALQLLEVEVELLVEGSAEQLREMFDVFVRNAHYIYN